MNRRGDRTLFEAGTHRAGPNPHGRGRRLGLATQQRALLSDFQGVALGAIAAATVAQPFQLLRVDFAVLVVLIVAPGMVWVRLQLPDVLALSIVALTWVSGRWSVAPALTSASFATMLVCAAIFIAVRAIATSQRALAIVSLGYVIGSVLASNELLRQRAGGLSLVLDSARPRVAVAGINPNYTAYSLAGLSGLVVLMCVLKPRFAPAFIAFGLIGYSALVLTGTRGAFLSVVLLLVWCAAWRLWPRWRRLSLTALWAVVAAAALSIFTGALDSRLAAYAASQGTRDDGRLNGRLAIWPEARESFWQEPIFGSGAGTFPALNSRGIYAHNALLDIGQGLGLLGISLFIATILAVLVRGTRGTDRRVRGLLVGAFLCASAPPLLSGYWYAAPAFWVLLALFSRMEVVAPGLGRSQVPAEELLGSRQPSTKSLNK